MSFHDVPKNLKDVPLDDPTLIEDVLDLFVGIGDRIEGVLLLLVCDAERRIVQPIMIHEIEVSPPPESVTMLAPILTMLGNELPGAMLLAAVGRPGRLRMAPCDQRWARSIEAAAADRVGLIGIHLITPAGSIPIIEAQAA